MLERKLSVQWDVLKKTTIPYSMMRFLIELDDLNGNWLKSVHIFRPSYTGEI